MLCLRSLCRSKTTLLTPFDSLHFTFICISSAETMPVSMLTSCFRGNSVYPSGGDGGEGAAGGTRSTGPSPRKLANAVEKFVAKIVIPLKNLAPKSNKVVPLPRVSEATPPAEVPIPAEEPIPAEVPIPAVSPPSGVYWYGSLQSQAELDTLDAWHASIDALSTGLDDPAELEQSVYDYPEDATDYGSWTDSDSDLSEGARTMSSEELDQALRAMGPDSADRDASESSVDSVLRQDFNRAIRGSCRDSEIDDETKQMITSLRSHFANLAANAGSPGSRRSRRACDTGEEPVASEKPEASEASEASLGMETFAAVHPSLGAPRCPAVARLNYRLPPLVGAPAPMFPSVQAPVVADLPALMALTTSLNVHAPVQDDETPVVMRDNWFVQDCGSSVASGT